MRKLSGLTKYGKVVLSPLAHPRNFVSTQLIHLSNNLIGLGYKEALTSGMKLPALQATAAFSEALEEWSESRMDPKMRKLLEYMTTRNMLYDGGRSGALKDAWDAGITGHYASMEHALVDAHRQTGLMDVWTSARMTGRRALTIADEMFRLEDEAVKAPAFIMQTTEFLTLTGADPKLLTRSLNGEQLTADEQKALEVAMNKAGEVVLNTYPTFSRTAPIIKAISRNMIVGASPSFPYEVARTSVNAVIHNASLIYGGMTGTMFDGTRIAKGQRATATLLGVGKLTTKGLMWGGASMAMLTLSRAVLDAMGLGDDEADELSSPLSMGNIVDASIGESPIQRWTRGILPWYMRTGMVAITDVDRETGDYNVRSVNYLSPTGAIVDSIMTASQRILFAAEENDPRMLRETVFALTTAVADVFLQDEVLYGSFVKRFTRPDPMTSKDARALKQGADAVQRWLNDAGMPNLVSAAGATVLEQFPLGEALSQGIDLFEFLEEVQDPDGDFAEWSANRMAMHSLMHVGGLKNRRIKFKDNFTKSVKSDVNVMRQKTIHMKDRLRSGDFDSYEDFKAAFDAFDAERKASYMPIFGAIQGARYVLNRSPEEIAAMLYIQGGIRPDGMMGGTGLTTKAFFDGVYHPPAPKDFAKALVGRVDDENTLQGMRNWTNVRLSEAEIRQKMEWYVRAYKEEGYDEVEY